jgi:hypothetical protein
MKPYIILKKYESIPLRLFNLFVWLKAKIRFRKLKYLNVNKVLKNSAKKDICYILMGGLSVKEIDLNDLKGCDVMTANNFYKTDDYSKIKPKYHVITDVDFYLNKNNIKELNEKIQDFTAVFLNAKFTPAIKKVNWNYIFPIYRVTNSKLKIDISKPCSNFSTVTLACIQIAMFLGYKQIYLIGFDLPPGNMPHYYKESDKEIQVKKEYEKINSEFDYCELFWQYTNCHHEAYKIQEYAKKNGIEIFNTSNISFVRAFPFKEMRKT